MPFLSSLVYTGTRIAGQRERQTQSFEAGLPYFPRDYPSTEQYTTYSKKREEEEKAEWERKPPAKRVNYEKMGTRSPWKPDWKVVLGLQTTEDSDLVSAQRDIGDVRPWLLRGPAVPSILNNIRDMFNPSAGLLAEINRLRIAQHNDPLRASFRADDLWDGALVLVRLDMTGRGCPDDFSMIYQLEDKEWMRWKQSGQKVGTAQMSLDDMAEDQLQVGCDRLCVFKTKLNRRSSFHIPLVLLLGT
jgi:ribonuclease P/MRP protein subunit POP1